jgi:hypothetical protein
VNPKIFLPNPIENFSTMTPHFRAARKCPNSWTNIRTANPDRNANNFRPTANVASRDMDENSIIVI